MSNTSIRVRSSKKDTIKNAIRKFEDTTMREYGQLLVDTAQAEINQGKALGNNINQSSWLIERCTDNERATYGAAYMPGIVTFLAEREPGGKVSTRQLLLDKIEQVNLIAKQNPDEAATMLDSYLKGNQLFKKGYSLDVYNQLINLFLRTQDNQPDRDVVESVLNVTTSIGLLEKVRTLAIMNLVQSFNANKKLNIKKDKGLLRQMKKVVEFITSIENVFVIRKHEAQYLSKIEGIGGIADVEKAFKNFSKTFLVDYEKILEELRELQVERQDIYDAKWGAVQAEISERVPFEHHDDESEGSFSEYHIVRRLGLEHLPNTEFDGPLNEVRRDINSKMQILSKQQFLLNQRLLLLVKEVKSNMPYLLPNETAALQNHLIGYNSGR